MRYTTRSTADLKRRALHPYYFYIQERTCAENEISTSPWEMTKEMAKAIDEFLSPPPSSRDGQTSLPVRRKSVALLAY
jgi:hypothetical protein